jgi:hypothetical protein
MYAQFFFFVLSTNFSQIQSLCSRFFSNSLDFTKPVPLPEYTGVPKLPRFLEGTSFRDVVECLKNIFFKS